VGKKKTIQIINLILLLLMASFLVFRSTEFVKVIKPLSLQKVLGPVEGYRFLANTPLEDNIISFLELDDYTQARYEKNNDIVNLYIGYYNSLDKVSAAHSPLVCFPGQGWAIDQTTEHNIDIGEETINYAEMLASLGEHKELVLYWYQANNKTVPIVYKNKINAVVNKLMGQSEEQAFVRITVPIASVGSEAVEQARTVGKDFITAFYPVFQNYIQNTSSIIQ
jgi:EpsI family protein